MLPSPHMLVHFGSGGILALAGVVVVTVLFRVSWALSREKNRARER